MEILVLMLPTAVLLAASFVGAFLWASTNGQYEDLEGPPRRILND